MSKKKYHRFIEKAQLARINAESILQTPEQKAKHVKAAKDNLRYARKCRLSFNR